MNEVTLDAWKLNRNMQNLLQLLIYFYRNLYRVFVLCMSESQASYQRISRTLSRSRVLEMVEGLIDALKWLVLLTIRTIVLNYNKKLFSFFLFTEIRKCRQYRKQVRLYQLVRFSSDTFASWARHWNHANYCYVAVVISVGEYKLGELIIEGKTKQVYDLPLLPGNCILINKDRITAGDGVKAHDLAGKAAISNQTNGKVFGILNAAGITMKLWYGEMRVATLFVVVVIVGIRTAYVKSASDNAFISTKCQMIPIEWVTRRLATGSFLKRNVGVPEGYRFAPPKHETFFKDDANHDPQWSDEQIISAGFEFNGVKVGKQFCVFIWHWFVCFLYLRKIAIFLSFFLYFYKKNINIFAYYFVPFVNKQYFDLRQPHQ